MQHRHNDRNQYFSELAYTSEKYFMPYIAGHMNLGRQLDILEIGCGDGGNLLPFAKSGHRVTGIDISANRIKDAISFFQKESASGRFICSDIFEMKCDKRFDIVICHDVIEHIADKQKLLSRISELMKPEGMAFMGFPAWQMPFGGHQQICHNKYISKMPFIHLLPAAIYRFILRIGNEKDNCISELLTIKKYGISIEQFEKTVISSGLKIIERSLYFINPHYEIKFRLKPRLLPKSLSGLYYLRNYFSTSCFYLLQR